MNKQDKLNLCSGCRDNYYNHQGNSPSGECWMLKKAKPVNRTRVGVWQNPPYRWHPQQTLSCHHQEGSVWIDVDDVRIVRSDPIPQRAAEDEAGAEMDVIERPDRFETE